MERGDRRGEVEGGEEIKKREGRRGRGGEGGGRKGKRGRRTRREKGGGQENEARGKRETEEKKERGEESSRWHHRDSSGKGGRMAGGAWRPTKTYKYLHTTQALQQRSHHS